MPEVLTMPPVNVLAEPATADTGFLGTPPILGNNVISDALDILAGLVRIAAERADAKFQEMKKRADYARQCTALAAKVQSVISDFQGKDPGSTIKLDQKIIDEFRRLSIPIDGKGIDRWMEERNIGPDSPATLDKWNRIHNRAQGTPLPDGEKMEFFLWVKEKGEKEKFADRGHYEQLKAAADAIGQQGTDQNAQDNLLIQKIVQLFNNLIAMISQLQIMLTEMCRAIINGMK
ncbi:hypothetical protein FNU76_07980 [Chitinimonas arctica]|uniref:Uncharacterized protein n=1 Tax=Chitinimonas arctica TaxID=2594795 RepID=A0A516SDS1_9NEIS|nr:hypothetical protein [Chitinimonas arctica]QDQ26304.1 hypothetical protein FNU76_07980 [Chitinimonas arctica]